MTDNNKLEVERPEHDWQISPVQTVLPTVIPAIHVSRRQRRAKERKLKRRLAAGKPLFMPDKRYKQYTDFEQDCYTARFTDLLLATLITGKHSFSFSFPKMPKFDEVLSNFPGAVLAQTDDHVWCCMLPDNAEFNLNFQLQQAIQSGTELCIVTAEGIDIEKFCESNDNVDFVVSASIAANTYAVILHTDNWHAVHDAYNAGERRADALLAIDTVQKRLPATVVYSKDIIDMLSAKYDCISDIQVDANETQSTYKLRLTYK